MRYAVIILTLALLAGCRFFGQPKYVLEKERQLTGNCHDLQFFDMDDDGHHEIFYLAHARQNKNLKSKIHVGTLPRASSIKEYPLTYEAQSIAVETIRSDNCLLFATKNEGERLYLNWTDLNDRQQTWHSIFISRGKDTFKQSDPIGWDGGLVIRAFKDFNNDGWKDVLLKIDVNYDDGERGLAVVDIKNQTLLWKFATGSRLGSPQIYDIDRDGRDEIFVDSASPQNGLKVNGMSDSQPYFYVLNEQGEAIVNKQIDIPGGILNVHLFDADHDERKEIVQILSGSWAGAEARSHVRVMEWSTGETKTVLNEPGGFVRYAFLSGEEHSNFYLAYFPTNNRKQIKVYDDRFKRVRQIEWPHTINYIEASFDFNGDNVDELILKQNNPRRTLVLNRDFELLAEARDIHRFHQYPYYAGSKFQIMGLDNQHSLWLLNLRYNFAPFRELFKLAGFTLPWIIIAVLAVLLVKNRRQKGSGFLQPHYFDHLSTGILLIDEHNRIVIYNRRVQTFLNIAVNYLPYPLPRWLKKLDDDLKQTIEEAVQKPPLNSFEYTVGVNENLRHLLIHVVHLYRRKNAFAGILITFEDLTKIIQSQRSVAWAALTEHLAHDIKNPLSNARLLLERLKIDVNKLPAGQQSPLLQYIHSLENDIQMVRSVTDGFMQFSDLSRPAMQKTDIHALIDKVVAKKQPIIRDRIKLEQHYTANHHEITVDAQQIERALDNLLDNAIKAVEEEGSIIITTRLTDSVKKHADRSHCLFDIEIEDTGKGIPKKMQATIFEPFVSHSREGTGLGLAIVKKIIDDHGGHIHVHSKENVGSRFVLTLPFEGKE